MDENTSPPGLRPLPDHVLAPTLHAGFWRRVAAYLIDALILSPVFGVLEVGWVLPFMASSARGPVPGLHFGLFGAFAVLAIAVPWLYYAICESTRWQGTVGKLALGLRVTDEYGRRIGFGRASGRFFGKFISGMILDVGYMLAGWTARKQALHDLMARCCVVRRDALLQFGRGELPAARAGVPAGMPGWAIALIVLAAGFFILVPVVAILAAIAIPAYQNYLVRAEVAEGISLSRGAREAVTQYIADHGTVPDSNAATALPMPQAIRGKYVASVAVRGGQVVVTYGRGANELIRGDHLILVPQGSLSALHWLCRSPDIKVKYLPSACRE